MAIKLADTLAPMADFPAAMAKDVWFSDNESLQEKFDNGDFSSSGELHGATIAVTSTNVELIGQRVTLSKNGAVVKTRTFNENLMCNFTGIQEAGEYTVSASDGETLKEKTVTITSDDVLNKTVIAVEIQLGNQLQNWIDAGRVTQSFSTLDEVFASEITVRQLMTIHASVDVLKEWMISEPEIVDTFVANATAMKWMGLRDYAYDTLTAGIDGLEEKILASENWEYALKDHVPVMTSNTAPYGEAIAISQLNTTYPSYKAFNGGDSSDDVWHSSALHSPDWFWVGYRFINPIRVNRLKFRTAGGRPISKIEVQGSFDGENWDSIYSDTNVYGSTTANDNREYSLNINNDMHYTRYRLRGYVDHLQSGVYAMAIGGLQFYGRSLNVSVPKMTSNTAPYGEVYASGRYSADYDSWMAFNNIASPNGWLPSAFGQYVSYKFVSPIKVKKAKVMITDLDSNTRVIKDNVKVQASNDGVTWIDVSNVFTTSGCKIYEYIPVDTNGKYYTYYNLIVLSSSSGHEPTHGYGWKVQFYGVDYSEREFAEGSTMKYIYDNGIEFEELIGYTNNSSSSYEKRDNSLFLKKDAVSGTISEFYTKNDIDLIHTSLMRVVIGDECKTSNANALGVISVLNTAPMNYDGTGRLNFSGIAEKNTGSLDCSEVSTRNKLCIYEFDTTSSNAAKFEVIEWWLE